MLDGWATTTTILQLAAILDDMLNPIKEGQSWILLWDTASIHASEATMTAMKEKFTSYLQPFDVAVFRSFKSRSPWTGPWKRRQTTRTTRPRQS